MWKSKGAHRGSKSSGSTSYQHLPDDDKVYLPDSNVYVTTTSSGRPAIARKKNSDHGFDFLSEAFGIPTRPSFQRGRRQSIPNPQPRSKSAYSTPTPRVIELPSDYEESPERNEFERSPGQGSSRSSSRSNSTLKSILRTPKSNTNAPRQLRDYSPSSSRVSLQSKRRSHTLSHPPEPERTRFAMYDDEPDENDSIADSTVPLVHPNVSDYSPLAPSQFHPSFSTLPAGFQQFPSQAPPMMWSSTGAVGHVPTPAGATNNLAGNMSPQQAQNSGYQMPYTHVMGFQQPNNTHHIPQMPQMGTPAFTQPQQGFVIPPPPPPLFVSHPDGFAPLAQSSSLVQPDQGQMRQHCATNDKAQLTKDEASPSGHHSQENRPDEDRDEGIKSSKKKKQSAKDAMDQTPPSTPTMHMHICAGCGKTRSKGYHMTHPLKKGEVPEPDYCRRCIMTADYTDSEVTESGVGSDFLMTPALPVDKKRRDYDSPTSTVISNKQGSSRKDLQKGHSKRDSLLQTVSSFISNGRRNRRTDSLSTPEEGSDRASSPTGEPRVRRTSSRSDKLPSTRGAHTRSPLSKFVEQQSKTSIESVAFEARNSEKSGSRKSTRDRSAKKNYRVAPDTNSEVTKQSNVSRRSGASRSDVKNFSYKPSRKTPRKTSPLLPPSGSRDTLPKSQSGSSYQQPFVHDEASELERRSERIPSRQSKTASSQMASYGKSAAMDEHLATNVGSKHRSASRHDHGASKTPDSGWTLDQDRLEGSRVLEEEELAGSRGIFDHAPNFDMPASNQNFHQWTGSAAHDPESHVSVAKSMTRSRESTKRSSEKSGATASKGSDKGEDFETSVGYATREDKSVALEDLRSNSGKSSVHSYQSGPKSNDLPMQMKTTVSKHSKPKSDDACNVELPKSTGSPYSSHPSTTSSQKSRTRRKPEFAARVDNPFEQDNLPNDNFPQEDPLWKMPQDRFDDMPATPACADWDEIDPQPQVRRNSWGHDQGHFEQQAEQMAAQMVEDELLRAGKHSGLFGFGLGLGSFDDPATSTYSSLPRYFSHLTTSQISIESCASDEDRNDGNAHYQLSDESELGSDMAEEKEVKQIEFTNHQSRSSSRQGPRPAELDSSHGRFSPLKHMSPDAHGNRSPVSLNSHISEHGDRSHETLSNTSSFECVPPSEGSSVIAHTGHSHENFAGLRSTHENTLNKSPAGAPRRRIRRFGLS
ncbi:hypothetical protein G7054_g1019 [Neopestalotiopsis clavispora]|nr:hypothetical protein G7054_g1019 [Neopestalotiopsis clavispora]